MIQTRCIVPGRITLVLAAVLAIVVGVGTARLVGAGRTAAQRAATRAGLFTDSQAAAGEALYRQSCAACHGSTLSAGPRRGVGLHPEVERISTGRASAPRSTVVHFRRAGRGAWKYRSPRPMMAAVTTTAGNLLLTGEH